MQKTHASAVLSKN